MTRQSLPRTTPLTVAEIVDASTALLDEVGLARVSMRRLGAALGVDPMAIYHHVPNKRVLLGLVMGRVLEAMEDPDAEAPWPERIRQWAVAYRAIVRRYPDLVAAGIADPLIADGGMSRVPPLAKAIADSGVVSALVEAHVYLVVDFVHGASLSGMSPLRHDGADPEPLRQAFDIGIDTIIAGIRSRVAHSHPE